MAPRLPAGRNAFQRYRRRDPEKPVAQIENARAFPPSAARILGNTPATVPDRRPKSITNRYGWQHRQAILSHIAQREPESVALYATRTREPLRYMQRNPRNVAYSDSLAMLM